MHVGAKKMATAGLLVAFSVIMMLLSSVVESSSLFFIAAASFCVGIAVREWGLRMGFAFLIASVGLNFITTPSKLYCFTLAGMELYIWMSEWMWRRVADVRKLKHRGMVLWIGKYMFFNLLYVSRFVEIVCCGTLVIYTYGVKFRNIAHAYFLIHRHKWLPYVLSITAFCFIFLNVYGCVNIITYQFFT